MEITIKIDIAEDASDFDAKLAAVKAFFFGADPQSIFDSGNGPVRDENGDMIGAWSVD